MINKFRRRLQRSIFQCICFVGLISLSAQQLSAQQFEWREVAGMRTPRSGFAAVEFDGKIYVFGGVNTQPRHVPLNLAEVYDPQMDNWRDLADLPRPIYQATAQAINGLIYIFGGLIDNVESDIVLCYNIRRNEYSIVSQMPESRRLMGSTVVGNKVMLIGGVSERMQYPREGWWWNATSNFWTTAPSLNQPAASVEVLTNGPLWAIGGTFFGLLDRVELFDGNSWAIVDRYQLPEPRSEFGAAFWGDTLLIVAGGNIPRSRSTESVIGFNNRRNSWYQLPRLRYPRAGLKLIKVNDQLYAIGGESMRQNQMMNSLRDVEVLALINPVLPNSGEVNRNNEFQLSLFPNPVVSQATFYLPIGIRKIELFDVTGRIVLSEIPSGENSPWIMPVGFFPNGNYYYVVTGVDDKRISGILRVLR